MRKEFDCLFYIYEKANVMGIGAKLKERESKGSSSRLYLILNELKINVNDRNALNI